MKANEIYEIINSNQYNYYALRGVYSVGQIGETIAPSFDWDHENDCPSVETLNGTCGIELNWNDEVEDIEKKIALAARYGNGTVILMAGDSQEYGEDNHEAIIEDAKLIAIVE